MKVILAALAALTLAPEALAVAPPGPPTCATNPALIYYYGGTGSTTYGFQPYLTGIGADGWGGKHLIPSTITAGCGAVGTATIKVFVLIRAFPVKPTLAQWKARYRPLILAAIAADSLYLNTLTSYANAWAAADNQARRCGVAPNPPGVCTGGSSDGSESAAPSLPAYAPVGPGGAAVYESAVAADIVWLKSQLRVVRPSV